MLGQVLRRLRGDLSQAELAARAGLSTSALSRFELGQTQPDAYELRTVALALGRAPADLVLLLERALAWAVEASRRVDVAIDGVAGLAQLAAAASLPEVAVPR